MGRTTARRDLSGRFCVYDYVNDSGVHRFIAVDHDNDREIGRFQTFRDARLGVNRYVKGLCQ